MLVATRFNASTLIVAPGLVIFAALRKASASTSLGVIELINSAFTQVHAWLALAAGKVPNGTARAFVDENGLTCERVGDGEKRNSEALATALCEVPSEVDLAFLDVAGALAILRVPVVGVIEASLGSADPQAVYEVPGVDNAGCVISPVRFHGTDAFTKFGVKVVIGIFAGVTDSEFASVHVPVLTSGDFYWGKAAARAG